MRMPAKTTQAAIRTVRRLGLPIRALIHTHGASSRGKSTYAGPMTTRHSRTLAVFVGWLATSGFAPAFAQSDGMQVSQQYRISDSRFPAADPPGGGYIIWLDDRRVLFLGVDLQATVAHPQREIQYATYIWDVPSNIVSNYHPQRVLKPCYNDGKFVYGTWLETTKQLMVHQGPLGGEKPTTFPPKHNVEWNRFDCRVITPERLRFLAGGLGAREYVELRAEHGVVDLAPQSRLQIRADTDEFDYRLYSFDLQRVFRLQIDRLSSLRPVQWLPFSGEYLFADFSAPRRHQVFLVKPDGSAKRMALPTRDWEPPLRILGVRGGLVFSVSGSASSRSRFAGSQGLYVAIDERFDWLEQGYVPTFGVSPNGCRVAYIYAPTFLGISDGYEKWKQGEVANSLRLVDVCNRR